MEDTAVTNHRQMLDGVILDEGIELLSETTDFDIFLHFSSIMFYTWCTVQQLECLSRHD
jgi:hypothetical protein